MSTTTSCSSAMRSSDESSATSEYTSASYSTVDPPSHLHIKVNDSGVSGFSDPSASSDTQQYHAAAATSRPTISPVLEETKSALEMASSSNGAPSDTRDSLDADGGEVINNNSNNPPPSPAGPVLPLECDYDVNPTELYQAIEAKRWDLLMAFCRKEPARAEKQAATWVTRKEANGKLRWRLLPVHAAVIFQSPASIVEKLLQECPEAAQAKDD